MDIVYPYRSATDDFELRYSLRSLVNVRHDRVIVAGDKPAITAKSVTYVAVDRIEDRYQSSTLNIVSAIRDADIRGDFTVMHDDIFILRPWTFRHEHRCSIHEYLSSGHAAGHYRERIESTRNLLTAKGVADPLWFGLHTPTIYNAQRLLDMVEGFAGQNYLLRTLYHNLYPAPSERADDVKAKSWQARTSETGILSISDELARSPSFRAWIAARFPDRCEYELNPKGRCLILGYGPTLWADVEEALPTGPFAAVIASPEAANHWPGEVLAIAHDDFHADRIARSCGFDDVTWCGRTKEAA